MRYIKLYEEFIHDEIHDVMMSICDTVSFKESEQYPSTDRVRVYDVDSSVDFDPKQFEEYLEGWKIVHKEDKIVFIKGDLKEAGLSWLKEVYGNLKPKEQDGNIYYRDDERKPLFAYRKSKNEHYYINYHRIWSFFEFYFDMESKEIEDLISVWLGETYNLREITPTFGLPCF